MKQEKEKMKYSTKKNSGDSPLFSSLISELSLHVQKEKYSIKLQEDKKWKNK